MVLHNPSNLHTGADRYLGNLWKDWIPACAGMTKFNGNDKIIGFMWLRKAIISFWR